MEIKIKPRPSEEYLKMAKKAAHKYAMRVVVAPLAHKDAVLDVEQGFLAGAIAYREAMERRRTTRELPPHLDVIAQQALDKFYPEHYGEYVCGEDRYEYAKDDVKKGVSWGIDNDSIDEIINDESK